MRARARESDKIIGRQFAVGEHKYSRVFLESVTIETLRGICAVININSFCDLASNGKRSCARATQCAVKFEKLSRPRSLPAAQKDGDGVRYLWFFVSMAAESVWKLFTAVLLTKFEK